jgi:RNA polymerase sigma-70 factor (ECF subfamily)
VQTQPAVPTQQSARQIHRGDRAAFEAVVQQHKGAVFGFLCARVTQPADAEDLTQEVFLRFYQRRKQFEAGRAMRPWLMGIARNVLREHLRSRRKTSEASWTELCLELDALKPPPPEKEDRLDDALDHLPNCLQELGDSARAAIDLRYKSKLRLAKIGERLHRSEGAVKLLMFRARQALKTCLDSKCEPSAP